MGLALLVHILAGGMGIISGFIALYTVKGGVLHRRSGVVFAYVMLTTCIVGALLAAVGGKAPAVNIPAASLTAYLVITSLTTVRPPALWPRWLDIALMLAAITVGVMTLVLGLEAIANGGKRDGIPAFPFLMFAVVALLGSSLDFRMIRSGGLRSLGNVTRLTRHLWRMCFALFIAVLSFFIGQAKVIPKPIRVPPLLALPVLAVLLSMLYWVWRVRVRRIFRGIVGVTPEATNA